MCRKQSAPAGIWEFDQNTEFYNVSGTTRDEKEENMIALWNKNSGVKRPSECPICGTSFMGIAAPMCVGAHVASEKSPTGMFITGAAISEDQVYIIPMCNGCNRQKGRPLDKSKCGGVAARLNDCNQTLVGSSESSKASVKSNASVNSWPTPSLYNRSNFVRY